MNKRNDSNVSSINNPQVVVTKEILVNSTMGKFLLQQQMLREIISPCGIKAFSKQKNRTLKLKETWQKEMTTKKEKIKIENIPTIKEIITKEGETGIEETGTGAEEITEAEAGAEEDTEAEAGAEAEEETEITMGKEIKIQN